MQVHAFLVLLFLFWVSVPDVVSAPEAAATLGLVSLFVCGLQRLAVELYVVCCTSEKIVDPMVRDCRARSAMEEAAGRAVVPGRCR